MMSRCLRKIGMSNDGNNISRIGSTSAEIKMSLFCILQSKILSGKKPSRKSRNNWNEGTRITQLDRMAYQSNVFGLLVISVSISWSTCRTIVWPLKSSLMNGDRVQLHLSTRTKVTTWIAQNTQELKCHCFKLNDSISQARRRAVITIRANQYGFRANRGTVDAIFDIRILTEKFNPHNEIFHAVFVDVVKSYGTLPRDLVWSSQRMKGLSETYNRIIEEMYKNCTTSVKSNPDKAEPTLPKLKSGSIKVLLWTHCSSSLF